MKLSKNAQRKPTVTAVVTSCKRLDLLEETLKSFIDHNTYPLKEFIIIEDSPEEGVHEFSKVLQGVNHRILVNGKNIGQIASIDRAYGEIDSDYIFHLEDDWRFTCPGFIERAIEVLEHEPNVILVCVRDDGDMPRYVRSLKTYATTMARYKRMFPQLHFAWYTFTFNPGLKRTADYRAIPGGYSAIGEEASLNRHYKDGGYDMAWLLNGGARHIGDKRSNYAGDRSDCNGQIKRIGPLFTANNLLKWRESVRRKFWHMLRRLGIDTEPLQRGRPS